MNAPALTVISDAQLWQMSRAGNREAFARIIERYQSLICSLAYSACGDLSRSEDLAQEAFVTAWQRLDDLREPSKLRPWLCGIVRNLAANAVRREQRRGGHAESLDAVDEPASPEADPAARAVSKEEEALLWRSLAALPVTYREPMVLFYRQGQSVPEVAASLGLSEEAVKQRLSRGRAMLRDELTAVIETTLTRSKPGPAFTAGVLVALPMASGAGVTAAAAAGKALAGNAAEGILAKIGLTTVVGPLIGLGFAYLGTKAAASTARSPQERSTLLRFSRWIIAFCFVMSIALAGVLSQAGKLYEASAAGVILGVSLWTVSLVGGIMLICRRLDREVRRIRAETDTSDEAYARELAARGKVLRRPKYFESRTRLLGLPLFAAAWGGANSVEGRSRAVRAWLAIGDVAISPLFAFGGIAIAPIALGAITLGILSLSLFWGVAFGGFAVGSLAFGWWALGCAAAGVRCAVGFAAIARDYAIGFVTSAAEPGTAAAKAWVKTEWFRDFVDAMTGGMPWWILISVGIAVALRFTGGRRQHSETAPECRPDEDA